MICFVLQVIGRLIVGFAVSLSAIGECIYISEIAPKVRHTYIKTVEFSIPGLLLV